MMAPPHRAALLCAMLMSMAAVRHTNGPGPGPVIFTADALQHGLTVSFAFSRRAGLKAGKRNALSASASSLSASASASSSEEEETPLGALRPKLADGSYSPRFLDDNGLEIITDTDGRVTARPRESNNAKIAAPVTVTENQNTSTLQTAKSYSQDLQNKRKGRPAKSSTTEPTRNKPKPATMLKDLPAGLVPKAGFNVVLTHCTADFDSLASAVGLAKLWSAEELESVIPNIAHKNNNTKHNNNREDDNSKSFDSASHVPTFVVLPRGAHPSVQRFLALHKHLFPIRSLKSLPTDLSGLNRLALVDAQRRDRIGPAEPLLQHAKRVTVVDHHIDQDSDIPATDYVVDQVGSVSTLIAERLQQHQVHLTEAEATLLALGVHADTGSLRFDSTTPRDAYALAWCMSQGASQAAIAEHGQSSLSVEQQGVLTQTLMNANTTVVHGVTVSTVLLTSDGFINGLAAVTQDALELSSSDVFLMGVVYDAQSGGSRNSKKKKQESGALLTTRLLAGMHGMMEGNSGDTGGSGSSSSSSSSYATYDTMFAQAWRGGAEAVQRNRLRAAFHRNDRDGSGYLDASEISAAFQASGVIASRESVENLIEIIDTNGDGKISLDEFIAFAINAEKELQQQEHIDKSTTLILIGRVKAGVNLKQVKLNKLLEVFGGGGHAKAASATLRLNDASEAQGVLQGLVDELIRTALQEQPTVGDFMTSPVLSVQPTMTEKQVEDLFTRYDVRALPVVDKSNRVIGLVTYKEVAAAKQRLWNKEQKRLRQEGQARERGEELPPVDEKMQQERKNGTNVKGWMKQHVQVVEASKTMAEVESVLLENDVGCIPVVADGTKQLVGMVTRTDLLRQHRYYPSLPYHNKGFADSIAARKPIIELRKRLKRFDIE